MAAARAWVAGTLGGADPDQSQALSDARAFGFEATDIDQLRAALRSAPVRVWARNADIVRAFLAGASQWRTTLRPTEHGMRLVYVGLDYSGVGVALRALEIAVTPALWSGLALMEGDARAALNGEHS